MDKHRAFVVTSVIGLVAGIALSVTLVLLGLRGNIVFISGFALQLIVAAYAFERYLNS